MRFLRELPRMAGFSLSFGVMERMMASVRAMAFSSTFAPLRPLAFMPSMPAMSSMEPMPLSCFICSR